MSLSHSFLYLVWIYMFPVLQTCIAQCNPSTVDTLRCFSAKGFQGKKLDNTAHPVSLSDIQKMQQHNLNSEKSCKGKKSI